MSSRRALKKKVNAIAGELFAECIVNSHVPGIDQEKVYKIMAVILNMTDDFIKRINHTEPGNTKEFYKKFYVDFDAKVQDIANEITQLK